MVENTGRRTQNGYMVTKLVPGKEHIDRIPSLIKWNQLSNRVP